LSLYIEKLSLQITWIPNRIIRFFRYILRFGLKGIPLFLNLTFMKEQMKIFIPGIAFPVIIRNNIPDLYTFEEIFLYQYYDMSHYIQPKLIIDAGAYTGFSAIFFANKFPGAKIIAIEPEAFNFRILKENTSYYPNIELVQAAIWHKKTLLRIKDIGLGEWGFTVEETIEMDQRSFQAVTIDELLQLSKFEQIDILKINIEGAEKELFGENYDLWLGKVNVLVIELHDAIRPGCHATVYSAIKNYNFRQLRRWIYQVLIRNDIPNNID
jgi:FkbM family methyltransferase